MLTFYAERSSHFSKWCVLSGSLFTGPRIPQDIPPNDPRREHISKAIAALEPLLLPYANSDPGRKTHLLSLMDRAAKFALVLFMQPTSWRFDWKLPSERSSSEEYVTFPRLYRLQIITGKSWGGRKLLEEV